MDIYRKLAVLVVEDDVSSLEEELGDRFGPAPPPVLNLLTIARIRIRAFLKNVERIQCREGKLMLTVRGQYLMKDKRFPRLEGQNVAEHFEEILRLIDESENWAP